MLRTLRRRFNARAASCVVPLAKIAKANRIETMKGPAEAGEICSVEVEEK